MSKMKESTYREVDVAWLRTILSYTEEALLRLEQEDIDDPDLFGAILSIEAVVLEKIDMG